MAHQHPEFYKLNNEQVHLKLLQTTQNERVVQNQILLLIQEVMSRKIFIEKGYSSMFNYLTQEMKYSESTACRRLSAAKVLFWEAGAKKSLESGEINMTQLQKIESNIRKLEKVYQAKNEKLSYPEKKALVQAIICEIKNKDSHNTDAIIEQKMGFNPGFETKTKEKHHSDGGVTLEVKLTQEQYQKWKMAKSILSHSVPDQNASKVIEYMSDQILKRRTIKENSENESQIKNNQPEDSQPKNNQPKNNQPEGSQPKNNQLKNSQAKNSQTKGIQVNENQVKENEVKEKPHLQSQILLRRPIPQRSPIPASLKRQIFLRDRCCQYKNSTTGKHCASYHQLEVDHIKPIWAGGGNEPSNLQVLCRTHNQYKYQQQSGVT